MAIELVRALVKKWKLTTYPNDPIDCIFSQEITLIITLQITATDLHAYRQFIF